MMLLSSFGFVLASSGANMKACLLSAGLSALPGGVKFPDSAGAFHYEDSGKLLSVTSNRFIHWSVTTAYFLQTSSLLMSLRLNSSFSITLNTCHFKFAAVKISLISSSATSHKEEFKNNLFSIKWKKCKDVHFLYMWKHKWHYHTDWERVGLRCLVVVCLLYNRLNSRDIVCFVLFCFFHSNHI